MTKDKVAKMLGKKEFKPVESKHPDLTVVNKVVKENTKGFKHKLEKEKFDLTSKLPKPKKLKKLNLGKKFR